jgi:hypothetical protein
MLLFIKHYDLMRLLKLSFLEIIQFKAAILQLTYMDNLFYIL